jgi:hypothetical protein
MSKLKTSAAQKAQHTRYQTSGTYSKNRIRDLERHLNKHPDDIQAADRLLELSMNVSWRRSNTKKSAHHGLHKQNREKVLERREMVKRELKSRPRAGPPSWVALLKKFALTLKPKIRMKRRRGNRTKKQHQN